MSDERQLAWQDERSMPAAGHQVLHHGGRAER